MSAEVPLMAAIFSAVLESKMEIVTRTPRGRWAVVAFADQVPFVVNERVPFAVIWSEREV